MNQILYTGGKKKGSKDIKLVMKVFSITIIVFGLFLTSNASYTLYKNMNQSSNTSTDKPIINVEKVNDQYVLISASHSKQINNIVYQWNEEDPITVEGNGTTSLQEEVKLPSGTNTLKITATDLNGQSISYEKQYIAGSLPEIDLSVDGTNIKATVTSEEGLSYITYRWDDEEETREEVDGETSSELTIEIPQGLHTLTIIAVDINNNTETKTQDVKGVTKPVLEVTTDGQNFIIKATDKENLEKIEYSLNGEENSIDIDGTEYNYNIPLVDGENKLIITVYNSNGLTVQRKCKFVK